MISDRSLREIQERLSIAEVIGGYVSLKKAGRNFKALCPFHPEKTPSLVVYPEKQFFICYGCGAGGDLFTFVMKHEHLEFREAVEVLAQKAGVGVSTADDGGPRKELSELYRAHEVAARYYHDQLLHSPEAETARAYLKKRGLQPETWKEFLLGFAPFRWDGFVAHAQREGLASEVLERSGLAIARPKGEGAYDRFRGRVMFPIWDARGRVIAFGGRVLEDAEGLPSATTEGPKYMNSPETDLYVKGKVLYGIHLAVPHIREKDFCIVVEGYMDLVSPHQHGIRNVVASMGTSLTDFQVRLIKRHTRHVVMVYDGDYAGEAATLRGLELFLEAEMRVRVAVLPGGTDPDSLIRNHGLEALARALKESQEFFDYKLAFLCRRFDPKDLQGRVQICQEMLPTIKRVPNAILRGEYIHRLAEALGVEEGLLWAELQRVRLNGSSGRRPPAMEAAAAAVRPTAIRAEDLLAGLLLEEPARVRMLEGRLDLDDLRDADVRRLVAWLVGRWRNGSLPAGHQEFLQTLPRESGEWEGRLAQWLAWADSIGEKERSLDELLGRIRESRHRAALEGLRALIREAEQAGDEAKASELIVEYSRRVKTQAKEAR